MLARNLVVFSLLRFPFILQALLLRQLLLGGDLNDRILEFTSLSCVSTVDSKGALVAPCLSLKIVACHTSTVDLDRAFSGCGLLLYRILVLLPRLLDVRTVTTEASTRSVTIELGRRVLR